jgi:hypothetical protein
MPALDVFGAHEAQVRKETAMSIVRQIVEAIVRYVDEGTKPERMGPEEAIEVLEEVIEHLQVRVDVLREDRNK